MRRLSVLGVVLCLAVLGQPFCYAFPGRGEQKEEKLVAKIEREKNPGKKARLQVRLARLKLRQAIDAYDHNDFHRGFALLQEYRQQIDIAWKTLEGSRRGVSKHFEAYKKLEIALREDGRLIEDLRGRVPYPEDEPIKEIAEESSKVHSQVLGVLFPHGNPPQKSKKGRGMSGLRATRLAVGA
jgi:hypothetical protein